ncbi:MAG: hypothetical protein JNJ99_16265 [Crocinitomicaceae bacterium]|jgi:hypothetical protein|nr:hypothetical protein [Crocinitomicaceae bacterium]
MQNQVNRMRAMQNAQKPVNNGAFLKSLIKINNPDWTTEQIEAEFQRKMNAIESDDNGTCEACSG